MRTTSTWVILAAMCAVALAVVAPESSGRTTAAVATCPKGTVKAVIESKRACLKAGQKCVARYQAQYARYGFDCVNRRLKKPNHRIQVIGTEEFVYDFERDSCGGLDWADGGVRAFRDATGQVQLIMPSIDSNRRMIGPDLDHLTHDCTVTLPSNQNSDPAAYDNGNWLASVYTLDGTTVYGLTHMEYVGALFPGMCPYGFDGDWVSCWWNTITLVISSDGGRSYQRAPKRNGLVGAIPYRYDPSGIGFEGMGLGGITQIVRNPADRYYYTLSGDIIAPRNGKEGRGHHCLMRTKNLADPTSWRGWDGRGFSITFVDPYREPTEPTSAHICAPLAPLAFPGGSVNLSLSWNTFLKRWLVVYQLVAGGYWFTTSSDLTTWTAPKKVLDRPHFFSARCGDTSMVSYGSVIDPTSTSRNFETTGRRPYFYYDVSTLTWPNCTRVITGTQLVRVQLEISK